jgi:hypothetical protein
MKKYLSTLVALLLTVFFFISCKKTPVTPTPPSGIQAKCVIKSETNSLAGNQKYIEYQFDDKGLLTSVNATTPLGSPLVNYKISDNVIVASFEYLGKTNFTSTKYEVSDIYNELPSRASVSIKDGDTVRVNYYSYFFFYNSKKQLVKVGEQTNNVIGDWEYDLNIYYNEQGNVSGLQYQWTTGPNQVVPPTIVTAYDDKPNPYAAVKGWPYFLMNFSWNNYDPAPIIIALSKNNPLNYTTGSGTSLFKRTMSYQYNEKGFPTERKNTNKNANGEYTFLETFTYNCK